MIAFDVHWGLTAQYMSDLLTPYKPVCNLSSIDRSLLGFPWSNLKTKDQGFSTQALRLWNDLAVEIREANTLSSLVQWRRLAWAFPTLTPNID